MEDNFDNTLSYFLYNITLKHYNQSTQHVKCQILFVFMHADLLYLYTSIFISATIDNRTTPTKETIACFFLLSAFTFI